MKRKALITGITGQDGSYLAELLLEKDYEVYGIIRRQSTGNTTENINHIIKDINLEYGDMSDANSLQNAVSLIRPHEIYNLAAQSHVKVSYDNPVYSTNVIALGSLYLMESMRHFVPYSRYYQASSSEMFGNSKDEDGYQRETTKFIPANPYACAKLFAYNLGVNYRNAYNLFISNGILFNHESPRRGEQFVTTKVVKEAVKIKLGLSDELRLGTLDSSRDWGHAKDYVKAMWMMLQHTNGDDFVCATGVNHSVKELCEYTFNKLNLDYTQYVKIDSKHKRPEELRYLKGDSTKLRTVLGWEPDYTFESMLDEMVEYWLNKLS
jgi:GDPmannose 4,6-dehydratase